MACDLPGYVVDHRGEMGGSVETYRLQALIVGLHYPLNPTTVGVQGVSILHRQKDDSTYIHTTSWKDKPFFKQT